MDALSLRAEAISAPDVRALLTRHFELMRSQSPEESCHVMTPERLMEAGGELLGLRRDGQLLGVGVLTQITPGAGELKSMHTAAEARGQGVARQILSGLIERARRRKMTELFLETGTADAFSAARALYRSAGFVDCPPFGSYTADPLSVFMRLRLAD